MSEKLERLVDVLVCVCVCVSGIQNNTQFLQRSTSIGLNSHSWLQI